jgi:serine/threonine-protein kinase
MPLEAGSQDSSGPTKESGRFFRRARIPLAIGGVLILGVLAVVTQRMFADTKPPSGAPPVMASPPAASGPALDGAYRMDYDGSKQTFNGQPTGIAPSTTWWAFRSACTSTGCVATATKLDQTNHQIASTTTAGKTSVLHFVDGRWRELTPTMNWMPCVTKFGVTAVEDGLASWSLEPQADGTLRGDETTTAQSKECGLAGVLVQPVVASRIGDVPVGVAVADPTKVGENSAPPPTAPPGPVGKITLGDTCGFTGRVAIDLAADKQVICNGSVWEETPQMMTGDRTTGTPCDEPGAVSLSDDGFGIVCDAATKVWIHYYPR